MLGMFNENSRSMSLLLSPLKRIHLLHTGYSNIVNYLKLVIECDTLTLASIYSILLSKAVSFSLSVAKRDRHDISANENK